MTSRFHHIARNWCSSTDDVPWTRVVDSAGADLEMADNFSITLERLQADYTRDEADLAGVSNDE